MERGGPNDSEQASGPGGQSFLGVQRMEPRPDGVHLIDGNGAELAVVPYGRTVYINGRVMSFQPPGDTARPR